MVGVHEFLDAVEPFHRAVLVGTVGGSKTSVAGTEVFGNAEPEAFLFRRLLPKAYDVHLRAHPHCVPAVDLRVPQKEVVVVGARAHEIFCPSLFVEAMSLPASNFSAFQSGMMSL